LTLIFFGFIRDDPPYPRHPRSIDTFFLIRHAARADQARASLARRNAARYPDSNFHLSSTLRLTSLALSLYKINQRLEAPLFERPLHTFHLTIVRTRSPVLSGNRYSEAEYEVFAAV
jgi:hypothetical protein